MAGVKGASGRRPKPTHLKSVENSRDRRDPKLAKGEPVPTGLLRGEPPPEDFDEAEKAMWTATLDATPHGLLRHLDRQIFRMYVEAVCIRAEAKRKFKASSFLVKTPNGMAVQNPFLPVINKQSELIAKLSVEMGFTPASRTRIALEEAASHAEDAASKYF